MKWWVRFTSWLASQISRASLRKLGRPLGYLWFDILRLRRSVVLDNLNRAFPDWSEEKKINVGRRSVMVLVENFFELFLIPRLNRDWIHQNVIIHGESELKEALQDNKGVLLLSLHLGNGDFLGNIIQLLGYQLYIITKFFRTQWMNHLWFSIRGSQGVQFIEPHGEKTPFAILKALKKNSLVAFVLDQHMGKPYGVRTTFFGHKVGTAFGMALFYLKTKSPVVLSYSFENAEGKIEVVFERIKEVETYLDSKPEDREKNLVLITQVFTDKIEQVVRKYPDQWMWVHRRWKWKGP
ncbi:MAG: lysophospholipid acyltransferase family protein [Bdellovibrionales bacterium]